MPETANIKQLLEAGAHFGHQTGRWHPKMRTYIFTKRNGIHIIDLEKTVVMLEKARDFVRQTVSSGGTILFVGTKKQAQEAVAEEAKRCGMFYVNQRWLGGMLTNFSTIQSRIDHLVRLEDQQARGEVTSVTKKEGKKVEEEIARLNKTMSGFKEMTKLPSALFIIDPTKEKIALAEAKRMSIPVVAVVDTNCSPDVADYPIPANDDAIRAIKLVCSKIADAVVEGKSSMTAEVPAAELEAKQEGEAPAPAMTEPLIFTPDEQ